jgi:Carboxypeptidase regulatory-like domain
MRPAVNPGWTLSKRRSLSRSSFHATALPLLLLAGGSALRAQSVQGRVLALPGDTPVTGALVVLVDSAGGDVARAATTASGGFTLAAPHPGTYRITVNQIGWEAWRSRSFALTTGSSQPMVLHVQAQPYTLAPLTVEARRSRCGIQLGSPELVTRLLTVAQTALGLAEATAHSGDIRFSSETYRTRFSPNFDVADSTDTGVEPLASWPIQSAPPDSLRVWGFVRERGAESEPLGGSGPIYYGIDARVLFTDWFLESHCFRVEEEKSGALVVRFTPADRERRIDIEGRVVLDPASLELRRIEFTYVGLPRWVPRGHAGGEVLLRRLHGGPWVPFAWRLRAPVPRLELGSSERRLTGWLETGGRVRSVRGPDGEIDTVLMRELLSR